jgi:hypothetical protein
LWDLLLRNGGFREQFDLSVGSQITEQFPNVFAVERDYCVVLPALAIDRRRLIQAVVFLEAVDDRLFE